MAQIGVNTWVWSSPITTEELARLAPMIAGMGFDLVEVPIESTADLDYAKGAEIARANRTGGERLRGDGAGPRPDPSGRGIRTNGMDYVRHCIDAARTLGVANVVGPLYSAVGRTWQQTADERKQDTGSARAAADGDLSAYAADHGVMICVEPLNRFETSFLNLGVAGDRGRRPRRSRRAGCCSIRST